MATVNDFGTPGDTLAAPSLSEWAAAVAAELGHDKWVVWTPTIVGATTSAVDARYHRTTAGLIFVNATFTIATMTTRFDFVLPIAASKESHGTALLQDVDGTMYPAVARVTTLSSTCTVYLFNASTTYATIATTTATVPFTWAAGDKIFVTLAYQCAPLP